MVREGQTPLNDFLTIETALGNASDALRTVSDSPRLDAELLLARAIDVPRSYLFAHADEEMDSAGVDRFQNAVRRRADGLPMAYITGEKEFWSMTLMVSPATLVPRPETEIIVEQALARIPKNAQVRALDLGTGCGAIALAIAKERPNCDVVATDISEDALAIARENARQHSIPNVEFLRGDWLEPVSTQLFDLIVSNPPYVSSKDAALDELRHEPFAALASGDDGLDAIRKISSAAGHILQANGKLLVEHGDTQHTAVAEILRTDGWAVIDVVKDLSGLPRVTVSSR
jgi:release factor glutamine methyltransferase